ncbi:MAG: molybdopterin-dependent oxidoreductase, partial [Desulfobacterales bacterium]|nr:molybdopterin-dependent oxidoreductase [Desulfobacterales bacterium]
YKVPQIAFPECITYEGQEVAAVAAKDIPTAQKALDLIDVEYEILTPMLDKEETINSPPWPLIADEEYPGSDVFDRKKYVIKRGDIDKGFEEADVIVEDTYTTQASCHGTIQTRACVTSWDGHNLTVWDAIQGIWNTKETLATSLGLDPDNVRVIVKYLGGGFGSKAWSQRITYYAAKLSMMTGRPVRIERTRREEFVNHSRRWDCKMYIKMGAKKDGTLTAIYQTALVNIGAAANEENYYCVQIIWHTSNLHACPNVHLEQVGVYTNLQITGPTRSPLNKPAIFALESHMDKVAVALDMDPLAFRLKNYATHCSISAEFGAYPDADVSDQETKVPYSSKNLDECMKLATEAIDWKNRRTKRGAGGGTKRRG